MSDSEETDPEQGILSALYIENTCLDDIEEWILHPYAVDSLMLRWKLITWEFNLIAEGKKYVLVPHFLNIPIVKDKSRPRLPTFVQIVQDAVKKGSVSGKVQN